MANDLSARPWYIDTVQTSPPIYNAPVLIKFIEVVGSNAGTIGNTMADIRDRNGKNIIMALYQTTSIGEVQTYNLENWYQGLEVATLGTGVTLRVHVR